MRKALVAFSLAGFLFGGVSAAYACDCEEGKDCHAKNTEQKKDTKKNGDKKASK